MNPFLMNREERMADWKMVRNSLSGPIEEQAEVMARYWARAPLMKCAYDSERLETWPGPWEMINAGDWCRDSVAVGMEFTLRLSGIDCDRLELLMIRDYDRSEQMLALKIDNKFLLNYIVGEVAEYPDTKHDVLYRYRFKGRGYSSCG